MEYELMTPPFNPYSFDEMNKKQAGDYFKWFVAQIDHRIEVISGYIANDGEQIDFDYSPESLIEIWKWYEKR